MTSEDTPLWKGYMRKIVLIGDPGVGKTSLRLRFMGKGYNPEYLVTIGGDLSIHTIKLDAIPDNPTITFQVWDISGEHRFDTIQSAYFQGAHGALVVYDVTRPESFSNVELWINKLFEYNDGALIPYCLIANKIDLRSESEYHIIVTKEDGLDLADDFSKEIVDFQIALIETSALTGQNVDLAFQTLGATMWEFHRKQTE
ncbi:MAG: Rab family GTPase [Candidatus Hodarchaeota archaeon]